MPKIAKFSKLACNRVNGLQLISDLMVIKPTNHIVRGFFLDRSSEKGNYYTYRMVVPLFSPAMPNLSLNYSERISLDGKSPALVPVTSDGCEQIEKILLKLNEEKNMVLQQISTPENFIKYCSNKSLVRINMKLELAVAHSLASNSGVAEAMTEEVLKARVPDYPFFLLVREQAARLLSALHAGPYAVRYLVNEFENQNIHLHFPGLIRGVEIFHPSLGAQDS